MVAFLFYDFAGFSNIYLRAHGHGDSSAAEGPVEPVVNRPDGNSPYSAVKMPIIGGEKWACSSCIKGHRVSGCGHHDRELHHINPKGRPVKQCEHCRLARRSKSQHGKCDCGDKKDKAKSIERDEATTGSPRCTCHLGTPCVCCSRRETEPKTVYPPRKTDSHSLKLKPRLTQAHSESALTVFVNGHHKPCHRLNNTAHTSGQPYKIPRSHTVHAPSGASCRVPDPLKLDHVNGSLLVSHGSIDNLISERVSDCLSVPPLQTSAATGGVFSHPGTVYENAKSLEGSPSEGGDDTHLANELAVVRHDAAPAYVEEPYVHTPQRDLAVSEPWPWMGSTAVTDGTFGTTDIPRSPDSDYLLSPDLEWQLPAVPPWSTFDLPLGSKRYSLNTSQPPSHSGETNQFSAPALTASSSGAQSENDDVHALDAPHDLYPGQVVSGGRGNWEESMEVQRPRSYRLSSTSTYSDVFSIGQPLTTTRSLQVSQSEISSHNDYGPSYERENGQSDSYLFHSFPELHRSVSHGSGYDKINAQAHLQQSRYVAKFDNGQFPVAANMNGIHSLSSDIQPHRVNSWIAAEAPLSTSVDENHSRSGFSQASLSEATMLATFPHWVG